VPLASASMSTGFSVYSQPHQILLGQQSTSYGLVGWRAKNQVVVVQPLQLAPWRDASEPHLPPGFRRMLTDLYLTEELLDRLGEDHRVPAHVGRERNRMESQVIIECPFSS